MSNARKPSQRRRKAAPELEPEYPGHGLDFGEDVTAAVGDGVAFLRPASFDRLSSEQLEHATELMLLAGRRRNLLREMDSLVLHMREIGLSWAQIGWCVGTSGEAARQRWGGES